jgi:hypothetical protein
MYERFIISDSRFVFSKKCKYCAGQLVEAHAQADILHTQKTQAHADASGAASAAAIELEARYLEARGYTKDALAPLPEKKRTRLERLLGL